MWPWKTRPPWESKCAIVKNKIKNRCDRPCCMIRCITAGLLRWIAKNSGCDHMEKKKK